MSDELDPMWERVSSIMGTHTRKEIIEGVWEHTFTPCTCTSTQATDSMTVDELLRIAESIKDQRTQEWLEEYDRYSRASLLRELEELGKPMGMMSYLRYCYDITIAIPPMRLRPLLAEGTPIRGWQRKVKARNRTRRQHRAAFRRRKRGLA